MQLSQIIQDATRDNVQTATLGKQSVWLAAYLLNIINSSAEKAGQGLPMPQLESVMGILVETNNEIIAKAPNQDFESRIQDTMSTKIKRFGLSVQVENQQRMTHVTPEGNVIGTATKYTKSFKINSQLG